MGRTKLNGLLSPFLKWVRLRNVSKFIGKNKSILDAGCDDARLLNFIKNIKHYTGVDSNREVIEQNRKRFEKHEKEAVCKLDQQINNKTT